VNGTAVACAPRLPCRYRARQVEHAAQRRLAAFLDGWRAANTDDNENENENTCICCRRRPACALVYRRPSRRCSSACAAGRSQWPGAALVVGRRSSRLLRGAATGKSGLGRCAAPVPSTQYPARCNGSLTIPCFYVGPPRLPVLCSAVLCCAVCAGCIIDCSLLQRSILHNGPPRARPPPSLPEDVAATSPTYPSLPIDASPRHLATQNDPAILRTICA
jgi:hypothetical protein